MKRSDVIGAGILDSIPILSALTGGGDKKDTSADAIKKAIQEEKDKAAIKKAEQQAQTTQYIMLALLGLIGVGGVFYVLKGRGESK